MIKYPKNGCCDFSLGTFVGKPSFLTDVSVDLLDAFIDFHTKGSGVAEFDEAGTYFTLILTSYNPGIWIIEKRAEEPVLHYFPGINIEDLEKELIKDIKNDLEGWSYFILDDEPEEIRKHRYIIKHKIDILKMLENKINHKIDILKKLEENR